MKKLIIQKNTKHLLLGLLVCVCLLAMIVFISCDVKEYHTKYNPILIDSGTDCLGAGCSVSDECCETAELCIPSMASAVGVLSAGTCTLRDCELDDLETPEENEDDCPEGYYCRDSSEYESYLDGALTICDIVAE